MKIRYIVLLCGLLLTGCGKHHGDGREQLMVALNLQALPASVHNIQYGEDAWTDYILHVYCEIEPADFTKLISGRPFSKQPLLLADPFAPATQSNAVIVTRHPIDPPPYASTIPIFNAYETYSWTGQSAHGILQTTKEHDRIYVLHTAD